MPIRTDIRDAIKTAVVASGGVSNTEIGRVDAWPLNKLPAAAIMFDGGSQEPEASTGSARSIAHEDRFRIDITAQKTVTLNIEDELDRISELIVLRVDNDPSLGVTGVRDSYVSEEESYDMTDRADKPTGSAAVIMTVMYSTVET